MVSFILGLLAFALFVFLLVYCFYAFVFGGICAALTYAFTGNAHLGWTVGTVLGFMAAIGTFFSKGQQQQRS